MIRICRQKKSTVGLNLMVALIKLVISFSDLNYKLFLSISKNLEATYASSQKTPHNTTQQQQQWPSCFLPRKRSYQIFLSHSHTFSALLFSSLLSNEVRVPLIPFFFSCFILIQLKPLFSISLIFELH